MNKPAYYLPLVLLLVLVMPFSLQLAYRNFTGQPLLEHLLLPAYIFNYLAASIIALLIDRAPQRWQQSLGFIFMGGSATKFLVFFLFFYPTYKEDGQLELAEFASFFVPYATSLTVKTVVLSRRLNKS